MANTVKVRIAVAALAILAGCSPEARVKDSVENQKIEGVVYERDLDGCKLWRVVGWWTGGPKFVTTCH